MKLEDALNVLMSTTYCTIKVLGSDGLSFVEYRGYNQRAYKKCKVTNVLSTNRNNIVICKGGII